MSIFDANDALQRATRPGQFIYWRGDTAYLADAWNSTELGTLDESLEELLCRVHDLGDMLDAIKPEWIQ